MKIPTTIANWIADAEASYVDSLDRWFPDDFDRVAFCADTPAMAERLGERWTTSTASAAKARLEELALAAFRGAYLGALALISAYDAIVDPAEALDRLTRPLSDLEHDLLDDRLADDVAVVESGLALEASRRGDASPRAATALALAGRLADPLRAILAPGLSVGAKALVSLGAKSGPMSKVLSGVVNVAISVATLRYAVAVEADDADGEGALAFDAAQFDAAFRDAGRDDPTDPDEAAGGDDGTDE